MSKLEKLIEKILGFDIDIRGSHHIFRKKGFPRNISLKRRAQLHSYQLKELKEVLIDHGY